MVQYQEYSQYNFDRVVLKRAGLFRLPLKHPCKVVFWWMTLQTLDHGTVQPGTWVNSNQEPPAPLLTHPLTTIEHNENTFWHQQRSNAIWQDCRLYTTAPLKAVNDNFTKLVVQSRMPKPSSRLLLQTRLPGYNITRQKQPNKTAGVLSKHST